MIAGRYTTMVKHQRVTSTAFLMGASCFIVLLLFLTSFLREYTRPSLYPIYNMITYANHTLIDVSNNNYSSDMPTYANRTLIDVSNNYNSYDMPTYANHTLIDVSNNYYSSDIVEVKQFYSLTRNHSTKLTRIHSAPVWKNYKHRVVSHCERDINGVVIVIRELNRARPTHGGSSFRIISMSYSLLQTCSFDDYFNGTYVAFCFLDLTGCSNITIDLMYVDYMAYTDTRRPRNKLLWEKTIYGTNCYSEPVTRRQVVPSVSLQRRMELQNLMIWRTTKGSHKLFIRDKTNKKLQQYKIVEESNLCK